MAYKNQIILPRVAIGAIIGALISIIGSQLNAVSVMFDAKLDVIILAIFGSVFAAATPSETFKPMLFYAFIGAIIGAVNSNLNVRVIFIYFLCSAAVGYGLKPR
jgi:Na+/glutamate symporter